MPTVVRSLARLSVYVLAAFWFVHPGWGQSPEQGRERPPAVASPVVEEPLLMGVPRGALSPTEALIAETRAAEPKGGSGALADLRTGSGMAVALLPEPAVYSLVFGLAVLIVAAFHRRAL